MGLIYQPHLSRYYLCVCQDQTGGDNYSHAYRSSPYRQATSKGKGKRPTIYTEASNLLLYGFEVMSLAG